MRQNMEAECAHNKNSGLEKLVLWMKIAMCSVSGKNATGTWFPTDLALIDLWLNHLFSSQSCCAIFATPSNIQTSLPNKMRAQHVLIWMWQVTVNSTNWRHLKKKPTDRCSANPKLIIHKGRHLKLSSHSQWMKPKCKVNINVVAQKLENELTEAVTCFQKWGAKRKHNN